MANYVEQEILDKLERLKQSKRRPDYMNAKDYQTFMPEKLDTIDKPDESLRYKILDQVRERGTDATELAIVRAKAEAQRKAFLQAQKQARKAKRDWRQAKASQPKYSPGTISGGGGDTSGGGGYGTVGNANFKVGVGQYLTTVHAGGFSFTVNKYAAPRFTGFVNALVKQGYKPVSIGGYANRNQANGSGLKSLHAYGLAIDIDPAKNPFIQNSQGGRHALPSSVGALAAKYGLVWGGNWRNSKDYMHFSVPYGGRM